MVGLGSDQRTWGNCSSGVPWMVLSKLVLFVVYFGVSILTVNGLGKEKFGIYSLMTNIASYLLVLCGLGLGMAFGVGNYKDFAYAPYAFQHQQFCP